MATSMTQVQLGIERYQPGSHSIHTPVPGDCCMMSTLSKSFNVSSLPQLNQPLRTTMCCGKDASVATLP
jgi:hypothetical protein